MTRRRFCLPAAGLLSMCSLLGFCTIKTQAAGPANFMLRTSVAGNIIEGLPLEWTDKQMFLLGRDGQLHEFAPQAAQNSKKIGVGFRAYSSGEVRNLLRQEFDKRFEITTTQHFVVVHPRGQWNAWADRLESLFRTFTHYMQVRGFRVASPPVPLVAVVFRNQGDYYRHAAAGGTPLMPGTLGHYDPRSNRIFLFDAGGKDWSANAETIIHEATHQTAFNVGVHRRFAEQPRWLVEGLAMMFEARGVWDSRSIHTQSDRINRGRLDDFRYYLPQRNATSGILPLFAESCCPQGLQRIPGTRPPGGLHPGIWQRPGTARCSAAAIRGKARLSYRLSMGVSDRSLEPL